MNSLRICAAGSTWWAGHDSTSFGGKFFCPAHLAALLDGFDPRPYGQGGTDQTVKFIDGSLPGPMHAERHEPEWCVLARDGDLLTLRQLGLLDSPQITASVHAVYPAAPEAVYRRHVRCGPAKVRTS